MPAKRYSILNKYIRGSNIPPQVVHGLNNLWKDFNEDLMTPEAKSLFSDWAFNSEIEIHLQGGGHAELELLFEKIKSLKNVPVSKFNESEEELKGACTIVSFVASERIVAANNYIRLQHVPKKDVFSVLSNLSAEDLDLNPHYFFALTENEIFVASYISKLHTAS